MSGYNLGWESPVIINLRHRPSNSCNPPDPGLRTLRVKLTADGGDEMTPVASPAGAYSARSRAISVWDGMEYRSR